MEVVAPLISFNWTLVMVLITFAILYLIVKKFFFEKIHNFIEAREQKVIVQFENAAAAEKQAEEHLAEYQDKLIGIEIERRNVIRDAKSLADERAQQVLREANERAEGIVRQAEREIERERERFAEEMQDQVALLAIYAAEKILEKNLDEQEQMRVIDGILTKDEDREWKHRQ